MNGLLFNIRETQRRQYLRKVISSMNTEWTAFGHVRLGGEVI